MIVVISDTKLLKIWFRFILPDEENPGVAPTTVCSCVEGKIVEGKKKWDLETYVDATAVCSKKDVFSRMTGKKITLTRLLAKMGLGEEERTRIWNLFFESSKTRKDKERELFTKIRKMSIDEFTKFYTFWNSVDSVQ